jgi:hypothetical protein
MWPHMHVRGKSLRYDVTDPAAERRTALNVPRSDFNWQHRYVPTTPLLVKAGTAVEYTATFDNSRNNPFNRDPNAEVRWGDQTWEQMMIGWVDVAFYPAKAPEQIFAWPVTKSATRP